ncbi:hypothetical protein Cni_G00659 [Canna indica]|uniref:Uncharacterized protein n=1 Tax=Canna indica TaxID=4628 RepID=A0AAQ3JLD7_9LILI|nr:hypothetical protein Cni_G00659 [Canna indica]
MEKTCGAGIEAESRTIACTVWRHNTEGVRSPCDMSAQEQQKNKRVVDVTGEDGEVTLVEVAEEVHGGADGEDDPWRGELGKEAGDDADVGADDFEEGDGVERLLVVAPANYELRDHKECFKA